MVFVRKLVGGKVFRFPGVDMRTRRGRQLKEILRVLIAEFGDARPHALRELASYRLALGAAAANNVFVTKPVSREDAVRMSNVIARLERELRQTATRAAQPPSRLDAMP